MADDIVKPTADGQLALAAQLIREGRLPEAFEAYGAVTEAHPQRYEGYLGIAQVLYQRRDMASLLQVLPKILELEPQCLPAYEMFYVLGRMGGVAELAIEHLERAGGLMPNEPVIFEWLVTLYAISGRDYDLAQCLGHYARLRQKSPSEAAVMFARDPSLPEDVRSRIGAAAR